MKDPTILVVDDNPDHLELTVMALHECCDPDCVVTACDGVEALDYLFGRGSFAGRDTTQQPRMVLLDLKMVRIHGLDVLRAIRAEPRTAHIPVVMHSSSTQQDDVDACYASGASSYLGKSTDYDDLRRKVREMCHCWVGVSSRKPP